MTTRSQLEHPETRPPVGQWSRRTFLQMLAAGGGASAIASLLAACGPAAAPPASAAAAPKPTVPAAAAANPTVAVAAPTPAAAGASQAAGTGGQISVQWTKPVTFNPLYSTAGSEQGVERLIYGALVRVNDKLEA